MCVLTCERERERMAHTHWPVGAIHAQIQILTHTHAHTPTHLHARMGATHTLVARRNKCCGRIPNIRSTTTFITWDWLIQCIRMHISFLYSKQVRWQDSWVLSWHTFTIWNWFRCYSFITSNHTGLFTGYFCVSVDKYICYMTLTSTMHSCTLVHAPYRCVRRLRWCSYLFHMRSVNLANTIHTGMYTSLHSIQVRSKATWVLGWQTYFLYEIDQYNTFKHDCTPYRSVSRHLGTHYTQVYSRASHTGPFTVYLEIQCRICMTLTYT